MSAAGYRPKPTDAGTPRNFVMIDDARREVDVHLVDLGVVIPVADGFDVYGPDGLAYEVGALEGWGTIDGQRVPCCTAEFQVRSHSTYEPDFDDYRDVRALCDRFGIALPEVYERFRFARTNRDDRDRELAARTLVGDARARPRADEGLAERRVGGEDVVGLVALLDRADEVRLDVGVAVVAELDEAPRLDDFAGRAFDDDRGLQDLLDLADAGFALALLVLRGVVVGVLADVSELAARSMASEISRRYSPVRHASSSRRRSYAWGDRCEAVMGGRVPNRQHGLTWLCDGAILVVL